MAAGSFVADGQGNISSGIMDINIPPGASSLNQTFSGTYSIGQDGSGIYDLQHAPQAGQSHVRAIHDGQREREHH